MGILDAYQKYKRRKEFYSFAASVTNITELKDQADVRRTLEMKVTKETVEEWGAEIFSHDKETDSIVYIRSLQRHFILYYFPNGNNETRLFEYAKDKESAMILADDFFKLTKG